ncbi:uncharacterized protein LOC119833000 [Zerene cesonia]|uniref:uncharacterized protein LOC119833000 n=1 Tax=Zerene cesonia TaxID=33412 RepID=UPI0018E55AFC|nr:uncharacterized protein LOC119833000 [Zerene cesonia]
MLGFRFALLCVGFLAVAFNNLEAVSQADKMKIYAAMLPSIQECSKDYGVSEEDLKKAKEAGNVDGLNQCLLACVFKKAGVINDAGLFDVEKAKEHIQKYLSDSSDQAKAQEIVGKCVSVNDKPVGDSDGCERSKMLFDCMIPFRKEFEPSR